MFSKNNQPWVLILGIGNILMGDEGIGSHVAQYISGLKLPEGIKCLDGGTGGFHLLGELQSAAKVILIDATADGQKTGTINETYPRFSSDYPRTLTAHDIGLKDLIDSFYLLGKTPDIKLYTVSIEIPMEPGMQLSAELQNLVPVLAARIVSDARALLKSTDSN